MRTRIVEPARERLERILELKTHHMNIDDREEYLMKVGNYILRYEHCPYIHLEHLQKCNDCMKCKE